MNEDTTAPKTGDKVDSAGDDRTANNAVRHQYRVLTDQEKADMVALKDAGAAFLNLLHKVGKTAPTDGTRYASRELSIAGTKCEEAVMWAVKHLTR